MGYQARIRDTHWRSPPPQVRNHNETAWLRGGSARDTTNKTADVLTQCAKLEPATELRSTRCLVPSGLRLAWQVTPSLERQCTIAVKEHHIKSGYLNTQRRKFGISTFTPSNISAGIYRRVSMKALMVERPSLISTQRQDINVPLSPDSVSQQTCLEAGCRRNRRTDNL